MKATVRFPSGVVVEADGSADEIAKLARDAAAPATAPFTFPNVPAVPPWWMTQPVSVPTVWCSAPSPMTSPATTTFTFGATGLAAETKS